VVIFRDMIFFYATEGVGIVIGWPRLRVANKRGVLEVPLGIVETLIKTIVILVRKKMLLVAERFDFFLGVIIGIF
jgi:hypothetical protein